MRLAHFFIERPRFATVLSTFVTLFGLGALTILPVARYPEIVPPTVQVTASYPGASADTVARTVATPLEQEINGVENMLYMSSQSTGDGNLTITATFEIGTDINVALNLTQNRVQDALSRLPEDVQRLGVQVRKAIPTILLAVHLYSPDKSRDTLYLSNYATLHIKDVLARLPGVGDVQFQGARQYAMRIWLDPDMVAAYNLRADDGATLDRTEKVFRRGIDIILRTKGVEHVAPFAGLDATTNTVASNSGTIFSGLPSLYNHELPGVTANTVLADLRQRLSIIRDAHVVTIPPPPVQGLGSAGGFKLMLEDRGGLGSQALVRAANSLVDAANRDPDFAGVFTLFNAGSPSIYADIDRLKAEKVGLTPTDVFSTLQVYLGSQYVNDFNYLGRTYEVIVQANGQFRRTPQDITRLKVRNASGAMVPIGTVAQLRDRTVPYRVPRYNLFPAAEVQGVAAPGVATGTALHRMEELARQVLPRGITFEWTDLAYQQQQRGIPTILVFGAAALFVFLVLVAQYESWKLPLAIVLIVPMCLLASVTGLLARGMPIDILAQIGFVVLVGLAAKNAILIVEFARQKQEEGVTSGEAAVHAARTRLRPILMTSFSFILGVAPLVVATGAGAEMRQSLGTAVLFGMLGVTGFGLLFTPAFYTFIREVGRKAQP